MVNLTPIKSPNAREQKILLVGLLAAVIGVYFFIIEPLDKKTLTQQTIGEKRLAQLDEMKAMAEKMLSQKIEKHPANQLLKGKIANETLDNGKRLVKTQPLNPKDAKQLLLQLSSQGKVAMFSTENQMVEVWFWPE